MAARNVGEDLVGCQTVPDMREPTPRVRPGSRKESGRELTVLPQLEKYTSISEFPGRLTDNRYRKTSLQPKLDKYPSWLNLKLLENSQGRKCPQGLYLS